MALNFLSVMWPWEVFHRLGVHDIESLILAGALFPLDGGRSRERKKKYLWERMVSPGLDPPC
jgi:hypothetical protein